MGYRPRLAPLSERRSQGDACAVLEVHGVYQKQELGDVNILLKELVEAFSALLAENGSLQKPARLKDSTTQGSLIRALDDKGKFGDQLVMEGSEEVAQPVCASTAAENAQMHKLEDVTRETLQIEDSIVNVDML